MKIALVTETFLPSTDGVVVRLTKAIDYLQKTGHEVLIIAPDVPGIEDNYNGSKIIAAKSHVFPFYNERPWALPSSKVEKWLKDFDPDIVHAANPISLAASGVHYADKLNIPLICSFHTNIPKYLAHYKLEFLEPIIWSYLRNLHNKAKINLVTSQAMYDELDKNGIEGLRVLPKGVDLEHRNPKFYSEEVYDKLTMGDKNKKSLLFVGRVAPEKEVDRLKGLMEKRDDLCLTVVGDGPEKENLENIFAGTNTQFTGYKHGEELSQIYASADAFVFPSVSETLGLVITEAMASGTPVIAAASEPTLEQIKDEENGLIFDANSIESLELCLEKLDNQLLMKRIIKNGHDFANNLSWDKASYAMLEAYNDTLELFSKEEDNKKQLFNLF